MTKMKKTFSRILDRFDWALVLINMPIFTVLGAIAYVFKPLRHFCVDLIKSRFILIAALDALSKYLWYGSNFSDSYNGFMYKVTNEIYDTLEKETEA